MLKEAARLITFPGQERLIATLLLMFAIAFNLYHLYPEVAIQVPNLNDGVLPFLGLEKMVTALFLGQDPTDPWLATVAQGYPLFHTYQHLLYLPPAALHLLSLGRLPLLDLFNWTRYLLLSLFPLSIFWSMRHYGFGRLPAVLAGLLVPLLSLRTIRCARLLPCRLRRRRTLPCGQQPPVWHWPPLINSMRAAAHRTIFTCRW